MCGRFTLTSPIESVSGYFQASSSIQFEKRYNMAPSQDIPVVRSMDGHQREVVILKWGLVPSWAKDPSIGSHMINARAETLAEKPSFRSAFRKRRCIIPANGFYEWKQENGKQPYYIRPKHEGLIGFAGLWEQWEDPDQLIESFTIITTEANNFMQPVHDRMPVILNPASYDQWLNHKDCSDQSVIHLLSDCGVEMDCYPVSKYVNSPSNDDVRCIEPLI
jgi:putative SOS response-associated peptidase YedK